MQFETFIYPNAGSDQSLTAFEFNGSFVFPPFIFGPAQSYKLFTKTQKIQL